tara:strand:- start:6093 stop:6308 length:216 start_codon:yes stop_codon:yes gene_type:complete
MSLIKQQLHHIQQQTMDQDSITEMLSLSEEIQEQIEIAGELWELSDFEITALCGMVADAFASKGISLKELV